MPETNGECYFDGETLHVDGMQWTQNGTITVAVIENHDLGHKCDAGYCDLAEVSMVELAGDTHVPSENPMAVSGGHSVEQTLHACPNPRCVHSVLNLLGDPGIL